MFLLFLLLLSAILPGRAVERPCGSNICLNGGTCLVDDEARSFKCYCEKGFSGKLCQEICSLKCLNGYCVKGDHGQQECRCSSGWSGILCDTSNGSVAGCFDNRDCHPNEICVESPKGEKICMKNPCDSTPCQNNATCTSIGDDFRCDCPQGYAGPTCNFDVNECELDPCRNGGTCINLDGSFECLCNGNFSGKLCAQTECEYNPCQNNGTCISDENGQFKCFCADGFDGDTCTEVDTDNAIIETPDPCRSTPCLNGGTCTSNGTSFECNCRPEFLGSRCETGVECTVGDLKCLNGGSCVRALASSYCECPPNYEGILCEIYSLENLKMPEDACFRQPCVNGGTCAMKNNQTICLCPNGFSGPTCSASIYSSACFPNPCQNNRTSTIEGDGWISSVVEVEEIPPTTIQTPSKILSNQVSQAFSCEHCIHSDRCIENGEGSICICRQGYYGPLCDKEGSVCSTVHCPPNQQCRPRIKATVSDSSCGCLIGRAGDLCNRDTTVTFGPTSLFVYQSPSVMIGSASGPLPYSLSFAFRTTVPSVHLVSGENIFGQRLFSISLNEGRLAVNISGTVYERLLLISINDGDWYNLEVQKTEKDITVTIVDELGYEYLSHSLPRPSSFDIFSTRIGKTADEQFFIGCMADISIERTIVDMASSSRAVSINAGCYRVPQCATNHCHNGGICVDMWSYSECDCRAPFLPPLCMHSLPPSTFGHGNLSSLAEIAVASENSESLKFQTDIRLILRSNKPEGAVIYIGENSSEDSTFISMSMSNGTAIVRNKIGSKSAYEMRSRRRIDDNEDHEIKIQRNRRRVSLYVDGVFEAEGDIPSRFDHPLFVEKIQLGNVEATPSNAFSSKEYFKGSLQDIRINGASAVLHRTELNVDGVGRVNRLENVLEGSISDNVCSTSSSLCVKGSCRNTFNDYECLCNLGYYGRNCDQKDYCISSPCPTGGSCLNVPGGFLCTSPVTLVRSSLLGFKLQTNESVNLDILEFSIKTHSQNGRILSLSSANSRLMLSLAYGQLVVTTDAPFTIRKTIADGNWNKIRIQGNVLKVNNASFGLPSSFSLPVDSNSATLNIGQMGSTASFEGCLQNVQIGKLPRLSFYREEDLKISAGLQYWKAISRRKVAPGCLSSPQCGSASPCQNHGVCLDSWNQVSCQCLPGFTGSYCEINFDDCQNIDCGNGRCIDDIHNYRCECDPGYGGLACDVSLDNCAELPCKNDGFCESGNGTFSCQCKDDWVGLTCSIKKPISCSPSPCQNGGVCTADSRSGLKCHCPDGFNGEFCEETINPCIHRPCRHGTCQPTPLGGHKCICDEGYSGASCEEVKNLCTADTCAGKGICQAIWNGTKCQCDKGWRGKRCEEDVDECLAIPCENDGNCINSLGDYHCKCRKYYLGDHCEIEGSCLRQPCVHGECIQMKYDEHSCSCHKGYEGLNCENRINYCKKSPCRNGATCESLIGEYVCHCIAGFNGTNCENDIDECVLGYCSNGSMCRDRINDYDCICDGTGYQGKNCTEDINECLIASSCLRGTCTNTNGGYKCDCEQGFIGRRCSVLDPCVPDRLNRTTHSCVHGKCVNPGVRVEHGHETAIHECKCDRSYAGPQCSTKIEERRLIILSYALPYMVGGLLLLCLLGCILFFVVWKGKHAYHGHYSPSNQEMSGTRMQMNHVIKLPPEERLI